MPKRKTRSSLPRHTRPKRPLFVLLVVSGGLLSGLAFAGSIRTDGSTGAAVTLAGPNYVIPQSLGTVSGQNLFHSFQYLGLLSGESATIQTSVTGNVIGRVTGGTASIFNGPLILHASRGTRPALWLINPAGVVFGKGSKLDVPGAFHVSTADYLKFTDGRRFYADLAKRSSFSSAPPSSFGFLGKARGEIDVFDGAALDNGDGAISIVAGDVWIDNGRVETGRGDIRIVAIGQAATEIPLSGDTAKADGVLVIQNGGLVASSTATRRQAGNIKVRAGRMLIDGRDADGVDSQLWTGITSESLGAGKAGKVTVDIDRDAYLLSGGAIASNAYAAGMADRVKVSAQSLTINRGSDDWAAGVNAYKLTGVFSDARNGSTGNAGQVQVTVADRLSIRNGGAISSDTYGSGQAGQVKVSSGSLVMDRQDGSWTGISSDTLGTGRAGSVNVAIGGNTAIRNGAEISSSTYDAGNAGSINLTGHNLTIDGKASSNQTGVFSTARTDSTGNAGPITVTLNGKLAIVDGGRISSDTDGGGNAGPIKIKAQNLLIDGKGNTDGTGIYSNARSNSRGRAGNIDIAITGAASILAGGNISSDTYAGGNAGNVRFSAASLVIDNQDTATWTGISSDSVGSGAGGDVDVVVSGSTTIQRGGAISSNAYDAGNGGEVTVNTGSLTIDRMDNNSWTGIFSAARSDSSGQAGTVNVAVGGLARILAGGAVSSDTYGSGNAGAVNFSANRLTIRGYGPYDSVYGDGNTGIYSTAREYSSGNAGSVTVAVAGRLNVLRGGSISSDTYSLGNAGPIRVTAGSLQIASQDSFDWTGISSTARQWSSGNAGNVQVTVKGNTSILGGGTLGSDAEPDSAGHAGSIRLHTGSLLVDGQGRTAAISSGSNSSGDAGNVTVTVDGRTIIRDGGSISSNTYGFGNAGSVVVRSGSLLIDRRESDATTGILTDAPGGSAGNAGDITVTVADGLSLINGGTISSDISSSGSSGQGGSVKVRAGSLLIDGQSTEYSTGISSRALNETWGRAGNIDVAVTNGATLVNGGFISSDTYGNGNAGAVKFSAAKLTVDGGTSTAWTGISSDTLGWGNAGNVDVKVSGKLSIFNGGAISSDIYAWADHAGMVRVSAGQLLIDGAGSKISSQAYKDSLGNAGQVKVVVAGTARIVNGGSINSDSEGIGNAGSVSVRAGQLLIDRQGSEHWTGISSDTLGWGNAGNVDVTVGGLLALNNDSIISSSTYAEGKAGNVVVNAGQVSLDGSSISALATEGSSGQTGNVKVSARHSISLANGAAISIQNDAAVDDPTGIIPTTLTVSAPDISLRDSSITASSTGNVAASNIVIRFADRLFVDPSIISTSAAEGNGGSISIFGGKLIWLDHSQITTSVSSLVNGNGGDINLSSKFLVLNGGFIQANTAAPQAFGGNINLDIVSLVPSNNSLLLGGSTAQRFKPRAGSPNVIQAAAPDGIAGNIVIASPSLDVSGSLAGIKAQTLPSGGIGRNPCDMSSGSSLATVGRGGLPVSPFDPQRVAPALPAEASATPLPLSDGLPPLNLSCPPDKRQADS